MQRTKELTLIVARVDTVDALMSGRAYKPALPKDEIEAIARAELKEGEQYLTDVLNRYR